jgi:hypothetical protein
VEEDFEECVSRLRELHTPFFGYEFVRKALTMAIERTDKERELVSRLLSYAYGIDITMEQVGKRCCVEGVKLTDVCQPTGDRRKGIRKAV